MRFMGWALLVISAVAACGCANTGFNWFRPGNKEVQRSRAALYDPFPDNVAGPEVLGGRPPGYVQPLHEPVKSKLYDSLIQQQVQPQQPQPRY